jgi:hypothetical protein
MAPARSILVCVFFLVTAQIIVAQTRSHARAVDFQNFTYPGIWLKHSFHLRDGKAEARTKFCDTQYTFQNVRYLDLTGDRREEALVTIQDWTACGSSGVSQYYYTYSLQGNRPRLLWRFATGSESSAGLKDFQLKRRTLVFEVYGDYRIAGSKPTSVSSPKLCCPDCCPEKYTRLLVSWNGRRFVQIKRDVYPFPFKTIDDYERTRKQ